ncbi:unnamed protein product [Trichobilharzia regenti]|nr:unnamed protein product [Trichobilharzia regenti]
MTYRLEMQVCYIRYQESINAEVALHLNNTVFLDRALIVLPLSVDKDSIPDEKYANLVRAPPNTAAGVLPRTADWPLDVISMVVGRPGEQVIHTLEPRLSSLAFPLYPPLPATTDGSRIEEIRRTILVTNLDPKTTGDQVLEFFNKHAEVRCVRMAGTEFDRAAYVEFTQQPSIIKAFGLMGATLNGRQVCSKHSDRARSRSRSRARRSRSRRRSTSRRYRSRSRDRRRSPSRHSRDRRRSRTRSRSRSHGHRHHTRSRSRDRRRSDRVRSRSRNHRKYRHSRSRSGRRYSRSRSRGRRSDHYDRISRSIRERERPRDRERDREKIRERDREKDRERNREPDRRERERDKGRHYDKDPERRRDSKPGKHRDATPKQSNSHETSRHDKRERNTEANGTNRRRSLTPKDDIPPTRKSKLNNSSCSNSDDESAKACSAELIENGKTQSDDESQSGTDQQTKPTVVGVKLAGPEDMDHISPEDSPIKSPASHNSSESDSSGEAMDTEA